MSAADNNSGPPGPPPGPPGPPPPPGSQKQDVSRYEKFLADNGIDAGELHEEERLRAGAWRFYYSGQAIQRENQVALDDAGHAMTLEDKGSWHALLASPAIDATQAHKILAWFMGRAAPIVPGHKLKDEDAAAKLAAPTLERSGDGSVKFTGWVLYPPNMNTPYRLVVEAPKNGDAKVENTVWNKT